MIPLSIHSTKFRRTGDVFIILKQRGSPCSKYTVACEYDLTEPRYAPFSHRTSHGIHAHTTLYTRELTGVDIARVSTRYRSTTAGTKAVKLIRGSVFCRSIL